MYKMQWCMSYIRKAQDDQQASPPNANALTQRPIPLLTAMALLQCFLLQCPVYTLVHCLSIPTSLLRLNSTKLS